MTRSENKPSIAAVKELMGANHDALREIVQDLLQEMLEGEMTEALGAAKNERSDGRIGYAQNEMTAHGFRAMAAILLNEMGIWNPDAIEKELAHLDGSMVRRAYTRGEYWDERVRMMQHWSDYLDQLRDGAKVRPRLNAQRGCNGMRNNASELNHRKSASAYPSKLWRDAAER